MDEGRAALRAIELDRRPRARARGARRYRTCTTTGISRRRRAELERARATRSATRACGTPWRLLRAYQGRVAEAFECDRARARARTHDAAVQRLTTGYLLYKARRYDEAIAHARLIVRLAAAVRSGAHVLIRALVAKGDIEGRARAVAAASATKGRPRATTGWCMRTPGGATKRARRSSASNEAAQGWIWRERTRSRSSTPRSATMRRGLRRARACDRAIIRCGCCACALEPAWIRCVERRASRTSHRSCISKGDIPNCQEKGTCLFIECRQLG